MMNTRNAPLSPVSVGGASEFSASMYNEPTYNGGLVSPPASRSSKGGMMMNGFPGPSPGGPRSNGAPSPPASVTGRSSFAKSESGRSVRMEDTEPILGEHYIALRRFLASTSKDGRANPPPNKARDKLLRLSSVQFLELSTDVFDELIRRQAGSRRPPNAPPNVGPPPYLLPEKTFHPKRNQARQKLSTLGQPRFRDLATDVFCELERRIPRFIAGEIPRMGSPASRGSRGPPSRTGTPVNGMNGFRGPPPPGARMRRPSDASSIRSAGPPRPVNGDYPVPPSPGIPNGGFDRPQPRSFQSNTIVPNKSTMVEEDDDVAGSNDEDTDAFGLDRIGRDSKRSADTAASSEADKKLIDDYQIQVRDLREKLDEMEDQMKKKEDEMNVERSRTTASDAEKQEFADLRAELEGRLSEAHDLNDSMRSELDRLRDDHASESRRLREEIDEVRQASSHSAGNDDLARENEDLRMSLQEQRQITEEARQETRQFLQEMKLLSQKHSPSWEKQADLERTVEKLEREVQDWRNRYARTKTQLRSMRASSVSMTFERDAAKYVREHGFTEDNGLVKDVHVTKFQISVDELLQRARNDNPENVIDHMKAVVVSVRRIIKDIDGSRPADEELAHQQQKLKSRVSATANNLITASKNFASAAGLSPVSLLDAAASHLVAALVELLRTVKIRATPAGELEDDDDDGSITPMESTGFFSNRTTNNHDSPLVPPPAFQMRNSAQSSAYSNSPRESMNHYGGVNGAGGMANPGKTTNHSTQPNGYGQQDTRIADLKIFLQNHSDLLVSTIQGLVSLIRSEGSIQQITDEIGSIAGVVSKIANEVEASGQGGAVLDQLDSCQQRLLEAGDHGKDLADQGFDNDSREWRMWTQTLPPIAFEIARETKELVQRIDQLFASGATDAREYEDFS